MTRFLIGALLVAMGFWPSVVGSHPGRLDRTGCHHVRKDFVYKSGKVAPRGQYHCHRLLSGERLIPAIILDGREVLMDDRRDLERDDEEERHREESP